MKIVIKIENMKEYRLIKKYPSLPKDWEEGMIVGLGDRSFPDFFSPCNRKYKNYYVPAQEVTGSSEFWEGVVKGPQNCLYIDERQIGEGEQFQVYEEKDTTRNKPSGWVILTFERGTYSSYKGVKFNLDKGVYNPSFRSSNLSLDHCLSGGFNIFSVQRESDLETYTVGDHVSGGVIKEISFKRGEMVFDFEDGSKALGSKFELLNKPLFKTKDEVNVFKGQVVYSVDYVGSSFLITPMEASLVTTPKNHFYLRNNAEDYIILEDPCLSIKDIQTVYVSAKEGYLKNGSEFSYLGKLKDLVKSKSKCKSFKNK